MIMIIIIIIIIIREKFDDDYDVDDDDNNNNNNGNCLPKDVAIPSNTLKGQKNLKYKKILAYKFKECGMCNALL